MHAHKPTGWNTWDYRGFNRLVYLRNGQTKIAVQYAVWDESVLPKEKESRKRGELYDGLRWVHARRIGPHAPLGLPARVEFCAGETLFTAEAVSEGDVLRLSLRPMAQTRMRAVFLLIAPDGEPVTPLSEMKGTFAGWRIELEGAVWPTEYFVNLGSAYAIGLPGQVATIIVSPRQARRGSSSPPGTFEAYEKAQLGGGGALADAPQAMIQAVNWNTVFDSRRRLISSPTSRDWCIDWRGSIVFGWDPFFAALMAAAESRELARANLEAVFAGIDDVGFVPNYIMAHGAASLDRSMPCLGAYTVRKLERPAPDREWIGRMYPRLRKWHRFWMKHRNGKGDGLLSWGSNPTPHYEFTQLLGYNPSLHHTAKCAMYEAGLDNSPMYDDVPFNAQANTLELADVMLCSYYAMDCESLAWMADLLDRPKEAAGFRREYEAMKRRINESLWDEARGIYANRHWDGRFSIRWSPSSFFPLAAGVADAERAERLVREHLLNEREFWGEHVIPAIARSDPAYPNNDYWRGRIWGPFNFLVAEGLRRYRLDDVAADLAQRGLNTFLRNWHEDGGVYENYNADTGKGADVWNAARLYHWGGMLALVAIEELADSEPTGMLRFGSIRFPNASVRNVRLAGDAYDVDLSDGVRVQRNGKLLLECSNRAIIRVPAAAPDDTPLDIRGAGGGTLTWYGDGPPRLARLNDRQTLTPQTSQGRTVYTWSGS